MPDTLRLVANCYEQQEKVMKKTHLLIIDPQNDFCDIAGAALPVAGANADMQCLAASLYTHAARLDDMHVTLDSHNPVDIAHASWWVDSLGNPPVPFTVISQDDVIAGHWSNGTAPKPPRTNC